MVTYFNKKGLIKIENMKQYKFITEFTHNGQKYSSEIYTESKEEA